MIICVVTKQIDNAIESSTSYAAHEDDGIVFNNFHVFNDRNADARNDELARYMVFDLTEKIQEQLKTYIAILNFLVDQSRVFPILRAAI